MSLDAQRVGEEQVDWKSGGAGYAGELSQLELSQLVNNSLHPGNDMLL